MKRIAIVLGIVGALAGTAWAANMCARHTYASCYYAGRENSASKYHCTCGDDVYVRSR